MGGGELEKTFFSTSSAQINRKAKLESIFVNAKLSSEFIWKPSHINSHVELNWLITLGGGGTGTQRTILLLWTVVNWISTIQGEKQKH